MKDARNHEVALGDLVKTNIGLTGVVVMISWYDDSVKVVLDGSQEHVWLRSDTVNVLSTLQTES